MIDDKPIGAALSRDITRGEKVDADIDNFISKRHEKRVAEEGERAVEDAWKAAERRAAAERDRQFKYSRLAAEEHLRGVYLRRYQEKDARVVALGGTPLEESA